MKSSFSGQFLFGEKAAIRLEQIVFSYRNNITNESGKFSPFYNSFQNNYVTDLSNSDSKFILKNEDSLEALNNKCPILELGDLPIKVERFNLSFNCPNSGNYACFEKALKLILSGSSISNIFKNVINIIVPINIGNIDLTEKGVGFSLQKHKGAIFLSEPVTSAFKELKLAISIAHELGHQALMLYQIADTIIELNDLDNPIYSYARKIERPAIQSFHACVAISYMHYFLSLLELNNFSEEEKNFIIEKRKLYSEELKDATNSFLKTNFTEIGKFLHLELLMYAKSIN